MTIHVVELTQWIGHLLWPLLRITTMLMVAPVFGSSSVPARLRVGLGLALTLLLLPVIPGPGPANLVSSAGLLILLQQLTVGLFMGFTLKLVFGALELAGTVVSTQMGLGFAAISDPQHGGQIPVLSHFYLILTTLMFLGLDGHLQLIEMVASSFELVPISPDLLDIGKLRDFVEWGGIIFSAALGVALPAIASLTVVNLALGVMTRAAPQLNIFAVGFPISLVLGFLVVLYGLPTLVPQLRGLFEAAFTAAGQLMGSGGG